MKTLYVSLFLIIVSLSINAQPSAITKTKAADSVLTSLKAKKIALDKYIGKHAKEVITLVKLPNKTRLQEIKNDKWPDEIEYSYNILRDPAGKIMMAVISPNSESGDWDVVYKYYFDDKGNTFAFYEDQSIFNDNVKGEVVRTTLLKYYADDFKIISQNTALLNKDWHPIKGKKANYNFFDFQSKIYKTARECLIGYKIQLPK
jgi:hypothetical protein